MNSDERVLGQTALTATHEKSTVFDRLARRLILHALAGIAHGRLLVIEGCREMSFGESRAALSATLRIHSWGFYRRIALGGTIGAGEA